MEALIRLNVNELSNDFIEKLKTLFPGQSLEIKVTHEDDETTWILSNPAYAEELKNRIKELRSSVNELVTISVEELV